MRSIVKAAFAAFALLAGPALAQDAPAPEVSPPAAPAAAPLPKRPIPYTSLAPKRPATPRPAAAATTSASTAAAAPANAAATAGPTAVAGLPVAASGARLARGEALPQAELEAFVDGVVRDAMSREHVAGVTVAVIQNGQIVLKKGYGYASLSPVRRVDPDRTLFRVGSISKTFTWIALMKEVEAGHIRLNAPLNLHLPEGLQVRDQGYETPILVRHLMDHSAGFEDRVLGHLFERDFDRERPLAAYLRQERPRRVHTPGAISSYSNYGAALAGQAVAYVSGKPFERYVEEGILRPAGLNHTTFREPHPVRDGIPAPMAPALAADLSKGYRWTPNGFEARDFEYIGHIAPAGSASSTAGDMARYMQLLLNGGTLDGVAVYGPRAAQAFRTPIRRTPAGVNGWRHGFIEYSLPGGYKGFGHDGATLSFMSSMVVSPDLNLGVFVSTNTETGGELAQRLPRQIIQQFYVAPPQPRTGSPALAENRGLYTGYYVGTRRAYSGLEGFVDLLMSGMSVDVTSKGVLTTSAGGKTRRWVPDGDDATSGRFISDEGAESLVFDMRNGRAERAFGAMGAQTLERAPFWKRPTVLALVAGLTALAALATIGGLFVRNRREFRETSIQRQGSLIQTSQAALWLAAFAFFGAWASNAGDVAKIVYGWPGPWLLIASACVILAAALSVVALILLPAIWRGGRRVDSWTALRKAAFSFTTLLYMVFSALLFDWGALAPWG